MAKGRTSDAIQKLMQMAATTATLIELDAHGAVQTEQVCIFQNSRFFFFFQNSTLTLTTESQR